ncbi:MAG: hypothetical protein Q9M11_03030 [Mariprofundaceae bacterium]|nr:hypothetical protein [Mariprofundaceae bacterium]
MTLQADYLLQTYRHLYRIFPEDIHIRRPLIQVFQKQGDVESILAMTEVMSVYIHLNDGNYLDEYACIYQLA